MKTKSKRLQKILWMIFFLGIPYGSIADQPMQVDKGNDMVAILRDMQQQMQRLQETVNHQSIEIQLLKKTVAAQGQGVPVEHPSAPAFDVNTFQDMLGTSTDWIKGLRQGGDFRLRYGFEKDLGDDFKAGLRLVTGTSADPNSTNATLGNPGYFNYKPAFFDKAYAVYTPHQLTDLGPLHSATFGGGKVENPFLKFATTNVWDADITPEGVYETFQLTLFDATENKVKSTVNLGQFVLNENAAVTPMPNCSAIRRVDVFHRLLSVGEARELYRDVEFLPIYQLLRYRDFSCRDGCEPVADKLWGR